MTGLATTTLVAVDVARRLPLASYESADISWTWLATVGEGGV
jgi:hypothetical protein